MTPPHHKLNRFKHSKLIKLKHFMTNETPSMIHTMYLTNFYNLLNKIKVHSLTLDNTSTVPYEIKTDTHETKTDTRSFTVTTDSKTPNIPTGRIEHNNNDNKTTSIQNDSAFISTQNTTTTQPKHLHNNLHVLMIHLRYLLNSLHRVLLI